MEYTIEGLEKRVVYNLLIGLVAPRPIALVTSLNEDGGVNAAPYSAYNYLCIEPPIVGLGVAEKPGSVKDTARNIRRMGEFVVNVVTEDIMEGMNVCAVDFPAGVSEVEKAGFETVASTLVKTPRIAQASAALECVEYQTIEVGESRILLGRVVAMYVRDGFVDLKGPYIKAEEMHAVGRMNGQGAYVKTRGAFLNLPRKTFKEWEG